MISRTAEYALRAVVCLADHSDHPLTTLEIAKATQVPAGYLSKVLQALGRAELVTSQRGLHGGYTVGRDPREITFQNVIDAVDPLQRICRCPLGIQSHSGQLCPLHQRLDSAMEMVERAFASTTVAELLSDHEKQRPLCEASAE